jgi:hypothetical protein
MLTFRQFIKESALQRKIERGHGKTPIDVPDTKIVHHDSEKGITIYHALSPKACYTLGSGTGHCTNTRNKGFAHGYLRHGNMFVIHHKNQRYNHFIAHKEPFSDESDLDKYFSRRSVIHKHIGKDAMEKMRNLPHATGHIPKWEDDPEIQKKKT